MLGGGHPSDRESEQELTVKGLSQKEHISDHCATIPLFSWRLVHVRLVKKSPTSQATTISQFLNISFVFIISMNQNLEVVVSSWTYRLYN
jgi:hypothetical protein